MRLNKFISENTEHSRRKADQLIKANEILVNEIPATLGTKIDPNKDIVKIQKK